jgi:hypothetical protein
MKQVEKRSCLKNLRWRNLLHWIFFSVATTATPPGCSHLYFSINRRNKRNTETCKQREKTHTHIHTNKMERQTRRHRNIKMYRNIKNQRQSKTNTQRDVRERKREELRLSFCGKYFSLHLLHSIIAYTGISVIKSEKIIFYLMIQIFLILYVF